MTTGKSASRSNLISGLGLVVAIGVLVATLGYNSYSKGQDNQDTAISENTDAIQQTCIDIAEIKKDIEHIKEDGTKSNKTQEKILDKLDDLKDSLIDSDSQ